MKKLAPLLLLAFTFSWRLQAQGELIEQQLVHDDSLRTYKLYIPAAYTGEEPWPLVIVLHGFGLNPDFMVLMTGMNAVADTGHFLVVYPSGLNIKEEVVIPPLDSIGTGWNLGNYEVSDNDDVGFLSKMIDKISLSHKVDLARVYACGHSNGGSMMYRLACELSGRIAAVASVSGGMADDVTYAPGAPVPLMEIHGTADPFNYYDGIPSYLKPIPEGIDLWVNNNQCDLSPTVTQLPDIVATDNSSVTLKSYGNCKKGATVLLYEIVGGGHPWPGSAISPPPFLGPKNEDINGSVEIWNFFRQHVHPNPQGTLVEEQLVQGDSLRTYKLYIPAAYTGEEPWPLVITLHGFSLNPDFMIALTGMNAVADTGHFLVAYPQGLLVHGQLPPPPPFPETGAGWNSGGEFVSNNDDVAFLSKMIDKIGLSQKIDPARVYACGLSNGGFMIYRLACELPDRIAAFVSVSGSMPETSSCMPGRPVPLMEIHGTADSIVPYNGTPPYMKSVPESVGFWVNNNHCNAAPVIIQLPDIVPGDGTTVVLKKYGNCEANASVWLMDVIGAGHVWPTSYLPPPPFIGLPNDDVHGSSEIWNFFRQHVQISATDEPGLDANLSLYPNPAGGFLYLKFESEQHLGEIRIEISNLLGQPVLGRELEGQSAQLDIAKLQAGIYTLKASAGGKFLTRKFLKL